MALPALPKRKEYDGKTARLLIAFDIGTTFSGASFSFLNPGKVPEILPVTRFPAQEKVGGDSKIPTVIYYDEAGEPVLIGAETAREGIDIEAEEEGWVKANWFKLHLRPRDAPAFLFQNDLNDTSMPPPLPPGKTVTQIFGDYMRYLNRCTKEYIVKTYGLQAWDGVNQDILYILTHPNGWGGPQQADMRNAAVLGGLIPDTDEGRTRITFVTEGEASLHFCLSNGLDIPGDAEKPTGVMIVDAGGGTIDMTAYRKKSASSYEEIDIPQCHMQGAAYVTGRATQHFKNLFTKTRFEADIPTLTHRFDINTKHVFRKADEPYHLQFTGRAVNDKTLGVRGGCLLLKGEHIVKFFQPSVDCIVDSITEAAKTSVIYPIKSVFLVGGFSASPWLFEQVRERIEPLKITVSLPDTHVNKAVADGAVSFYLDHVVDSRVSRATFGTDCFVDFDPADPAHRERRAQVVPHPLTGKRILEDAFSVILPKKTLVTETKEFRRSFCLYRSTEAPLAKLSSKIRRYSGTKVAPLWTDEEEDMYDDVCTVEADTSAVKPLERVNSQGDKKYYAIEFDIVLLFGLTELKAQLAWKEGINEKRGPANVVYEAKRNIAGAL